MLKPLFATSLLLAAALAGCSDGQSDEDAFAEAERLAELRSDPQANGSASAEDPAWQYSRALDCAAANDATALLYELAARTSTGDELAQLQQRSARNREAALAFAQRAVALGRELGKSQDEMHADNEAAVNQYRAPPEEADFNQFIQGVGRAADTCVSEQGRIMGA